jgi:hypothetical protein
LAQQEMHDLIALLNLPIGERARRRAAAREEWFAAGCRLDLHPSGLQTQLSPRGRRDGLRTAVIPSPTIGDAMVMKRLSLALRN